MLSFEAQAVLTMLLKNADRAGVIDLSTYGRAAVAVEIGHPSRASVIDPAVDELERTGSVVFLANRYLYIPRYVEAQEAHATQRVRSKDYRDSIIAMERARALGIPVTPRDGAEKTPPRAARARKPRAAPRDTSRSAPVTPRDDGNTPRSAPVTLRREETSYVDPASADAARGARAGKNPEKIDRSVGRSVEGADPRQLEIVPVTQLRPLRAPDLKAALEVRETAAPADEWTYDRFWAFTLRCETAVANAHGKGPACLSKRPKNGPRVFVAMRAATSITILYRAAQAFFSAPDRTHPYAATFWKCWPDWVEEVRHGDAANAPCQFCADEDAHDLVLDGIFFRTCIACESTFEADTRELEGTPAELMGAWAAQRAVA